jgi:uncharacterized damage-inducible protein DinB
MLPAIARIMILRELRALRRSVEAYPDDASLWAHPNGIPNPGGTLALHIAGNLQHFIGALLGNTGYRRDRDAEFAKRGVPRAAILAEISAAESAVERGLAALTESALAEPYPQQVAGRTMSTFDFVAHLVAHTAYHLGQLDYHRRIVTGDATSVGAVAAGELPQYELGRTSPA